MPASGVLPGIATTNRLTDVGMAAGPELPGLINEYSQVA
jgi:hypothetical protein